MNKKLLFAVMVGIQALTGTAETYFLQEHETVSELLYDRLKLSPIYRSGLLKTVLEYNNLDTQSAQKLAVGSEIKLPSEIVTEASDTQAEAPVAEEPVESVDATAIEDRSTTTQWWMGGAKFELLQGDMGDASFSMQVVLPTLSYYLQKTYNDHFLGMQLTASYLYLFEDDNRVGPDNNPLGEVAAGYGYNFRPNFALGLKAEYQNEFYLREKSDDKYQFMFPWIYSVGPMIKFGRQQDWTFSYLMVPEQTVRSGVKTKNNFNLKLLHQRKVSSHDLQFGLNYMDNTTNAFKGQQLVLSVGYIF